MVKTSKLTFALLFLAFPVGAAELAATSSKCEWGPELDAIAAAPANHKVLLENEHVRVLEVTVPPHSAEPVHAHCWPSTLYIQTTTDMVDKDASGRVVFDTRKVPVQPKPPFVIWSGPQAPHSIENLGDVPLKLVRVEQKH